MSLTPLCQQVDERSFWVLLEDKDNTVDSRSSWTSWAASAWSAMTAVLRLHQKHRAPACGTSKAAVTSPNRASLYWGHQNGDAWDTQKAGGVGDIAVMA